MSTELITKAGRLIHRVGLEAKRHAPEILVGAGIVGGVASAVIACKATVKATEIIEEKNKALGHVDACLNDKKINYTEQDAKTDLRTIYTKTGVRLLKVYGPALALGTVSIVSIVSGHKLLRKRNAVLAAAYVAADKGLKEYRSHVIERFGEEIDKELRYNIKAKEVTKESVDEEGNVKVSKEIVKCIENGEVSKFSRFFDETSQYYRKDAEHNLVFLRQQQSWFNDKLRVNGHVFLNEVYEALGIPKSKLGAQFGWIFNEKDSDCYIDFGIYNGGERSRAFVNGYERAILLDFNVQGPIMDKVYNELY